LHFSSQTDFCKPNLLTDNTTIERKKKTEKRYSVFLNSTISEQKKSLRHKNDLFMEIIFKEKEISRRVLSVKDYRP
jgi:hypothetical protein